MNKRRTNHDLRQDWFHTNNFAMYAIEDNEAVLYFGTENNPILKNIDEACNQLRNNDNYDVSEEDRKAVLDSAEEESVLRIRYSDLRLKGDRPEWKYIEIDTKKYSKPENKGGLNQSERSFAEAVYGSGQDFIGNMKMLSDSGISSTRIYVLNKDYVRINTDENGAIARACWLSKFNFNSDFYAGNRDIILDYVALRGVNRIREADAHENPLEEIVCKGIRAHDDI
jgi:hypothetical protein